MKAFSPAPVMPLLGLALAALAWVVDAAATPMPPASQYYDWQLIVASILCILFGGVFMVYGYRLFRILVVVVGFIVGFAVCYILLHEYWTDPDTWVEIVQIIISIIPGVILSVLLYCFFIIAIFVVGCLFGFVMAATLMGGIIAQWVSESTQAEWWYILINWVVIVLGAFIFGLLAVAFERVILILATSVVGSYFVVVGVDYLAYFDNAAFAKTVEALFQGETAGFTDYTWALIGAWIILAAIGMGVQYFVTAKNYHHRGHSHEKDPLVVTY